MALQTETIHGHVESVVVYPLLPKHFSATRKKYDLNKRQETHTWGLRGLHFNGSNTSRHRKANRVTDSENAELKELPAGRSRRGDWRKRRQMWTAEDSFQEEQRGKQSTTGSFQSSVLTPGPKRRDCVPTDKNVLSLLYVIGKKGF